MNTQNFDPTSLPPIGYGDDPQRGVSVYANAFKTMFEYIRANAIDGDVLEFGTFRGFTARVIATYLKMYNLKSNLYLFDSFEGLPEPDQEEDKNSYAVSVRKVWLKGSMQLMPGVEELIRKALSEIIAPERIIITKGFFEDTIDDNLPDSKISLLHVDCDLYQSAKLVLEKVLERDMLQDGAIIMFDDYNSNRGNPMMGERRALREVFGAQARFEYEQFIYYGWHGCAFFVHDRNAADEIKKGREA